jgi:cell wall-associated NlpC family hydrolase
VNDVVTAARSYLGCPWHHMGRSRLGLDCAGLLICVARDLGIVPPDFDVPNYRMLPDGKSLINLCDLHLEPSKLAVGCVVVIAVDKYPQHLGIVGDYRHGGFSLIHSCNSKSVQPPRVIEHRLMFSRVTRLVAAYRFR